MVAPAAGLLWGIFFFGVLIGVLIGWLIGTYLTLREETDRK